MSNVRVPFIVSEALYGGQANVRLNFTFAEVLMGGQANVRAPLIMAEVLMGGPSNVRAPLIAAEVLIGGQPVVRSDFFVLEVLCRSPPTFTTFGQLVSSMTSLVFPALIGQAWSVHKRPNFQSQVRRTANNKEVRNTLTPYPVWEFELTYDYLPNKTARNTDFQTLAGLFLQTQGMYGAFLYSDPTDYQVTSDQQAVGDGATTTFYFQRVMGGFSEPVGQVSFASVLSFSSSAVSGSSVTATAHGLATGAGPYFISPSGTLPTGLTANTPYWIIAVDANTIQFAASPLKAAASTSVTLTGSGSGTNTITQGYAFYLSGAENGSIASGSSYQVTPSRAATFYADQGVTISGAALTKVASAPASGQYSVSPAGLYTFNSAQNGYTAVITYQSIATGLTYTSPNQIVFATAPAVGLTVTAQFQFYYICRFSDDTLDFDNFYNQYWQLQKLTFTSII